MLTTVPTTGFKTQRSFDFKGIPDTVNIRPTGKIVAKNLKWTVIDKIINTIFLKSPQIEIYVYLKYFNLTGLHKTKMLQFCKST